MNYALKGSENILGDSVEAILKAVEQVQTERRKRLVTLASSHRFDLIGRAAKTKPIALAVLEAEHQ